MEQLIATMEMNLGNNMPVDPVLKQDLLLVKEHFENKALAQDDNAALVPLASIFRNQRDMHIAVRSSIERYPAHYAQNIDEKQSILKQIQEECVPCEFRLKGIKALDIDFTIGSKLIEFDKRVLESLVSAFRNLNGVTPIETHICDIYRAYKSQCIPDLRRMLAAFLYLLSDLRSIDLRSLQLGFFQLLGIIIGKLLVTFTTNLDKYAQLITNTLKCVAYDLKGQLAKLSPILSKEARQKSLQQISDAFKKKEEDKKWSEQAWKNLTQEQKDAINAKGQISGTSAYEALPEKQIPYAGEVQQAEQAVSGAINFSVNSINEIIQGFLDMATARVDKALINGREDLVKILKASDMNLTSLNTLMQQIMLLQGLINILKGLIESKGDYNPCGTMEAGRRFFTKLTIPGRAVVVKPGTIDPSDTEVTFFPDPAVFDNPVIKDVLDKSGITQTGAGTSQFFVTTITDPNTGKNKYAVQAEPVTISLFNCLGGEING
jgi:hypothetical protein